MTQDALILDLRRRLGDERVLAGLTERLARAHDASIYRLVPRAVVRPQGIEQVRSVLAVCHEHKVGVTFRAAGTSLSGQAVTDGVLCELGPYWRKAHVHEGGALITSEPGVTGGRLNALLARHGRRIGPDPASIASSMIGGIVANNASGMCCGTHENAYKTLVSLRAVLADGYLLDTGEPDADVRLARDRPAIHAGLAALRRRLLASPAASAKVRKKYALKNTMGYGLNALLDFEEPVDVLQHLLVGSEGTLGFLAEVTLRTVAEERHKATGIAYFAELADAGAAVEALARGAGAAVLEIMDARSLEALSDEMAYPFALTPRCAALLIEYHDADPERLAAQVIAGVALIRPEQLLAPIAFTSDDAMRARYWKLRKGLFPKVGAQRRPGTAVVIEDICLPRARLAEGIRDLHTLFERHGFEDAVIFGHAKEGNLHFVLCNDFAKADEVQRYAALMDELAALVVDRYDGSLKAEHGTGRNMAPFVEREWGAELYGLMRGVKSLLDPAGILNPGVLITADAKAHIRDLKAIPAVAGRVDSCIECGFCEAVCPSRDLTTTPRQRIVLQREAALMEARGDRAGARALQKDFAYAGVETCAGDGMCASVCPVGIDTGAFMREIKSRGHGPVSRALALVAARHLGWVAAGARLGVRLARVLPVLPAGIPVPTVRSMPHPALAQTEAPTAMNGDGRRRASAHHASAATLAHKVSPDPALAQTEAPSAMDGDGRRRASAHHASVVAHAHKTSPDPALAQTEVASRMDGDGRRRASEHHVSAVARGHTKSSVPASGAMAEFRTRTRGPDNRQRVVLFSACLSQIMGDTRSATARALELTGHDVIPAAPGTVCCGQAFQSKGFDAAARVAAERLVSALWESSEAGAVPVVCDTSPCTARLWSLGSELTGEHRERWRHLALFDFPSYMARQVLPRRTQWPQLARRLVLHPTCSAMKHGTVADLVAVAKAFATDVVVPVAAACCGFAGDKGFRVPELTRAATRDEGAEVRAEATPDTRGYTSCQTCAYGMEAATGIAYASIAQLCCDALQPEGATVAYRPDSHFVDRKMFTT